jgi:hypothetical protein
MCDSILPLLPHRAGRGGHRRALVARRALCTDVRCAQTCAARVLVAAMQPNRRRSGGVPLTHELKVAALAGAAVNEEKLSQHDSGGEAWACIRLVLPCENSFYSYLNVLK